MINVLPEEGRRWIRSEYRLRLAALVLLGLALLALASTALLFPSYLLSKSEHQEVEAERTALAQALAQGGREEELEELSRMEGMREALSLRLKEKAPSPYIDAIVSARVGGVSLTRFEYEKGVDGASVRLSGTAGTRESLIAFSQKLERVSGVKAVDLPVSNLTKSTNLPFTITVTFAKS